ncbi:MULTISPECIES: YafY family protein [unclassified Crossiella]|uniref:helix-turn-helix transcriptional regulator n=1 Tax=unclassified Crossiella TaxID=2620835 RepID=UPI0020000EE4|nr:MULTISPECIES: YafY family protein [unclassified Crossiella]MCK2243960.1 YafY family transcriptional regulator [Crossiella sp. S99.2]MCK2257182.1 YafY family transcriptional regulator [Crossiella sp. S99.1]
MSPLARVMRLLSLLQARREWSGAELAQRLAVTDRTVRRDVEKLRELGYPVHASTGTAGGYRLVSGRNLPPLALDEEEAVAVATGLLTAAGSGVSGVAETAVRALAKLSQILPSRLRHRVAAVAQATEAVPAVSGAQVDPAVLAVLGAAVRDGELLTFGYRRRDGSAGDRRAEPHRLVTAYRLWYLLAYDPARAGWRTFRVDRITDPRPTGRRFAPRELPAADTGAYLDRVLATTPYRHSAVVRIAAAPREVLAWVFRLLPARVTEVEGGSEVLLSADQPREVARDVLSLAALGVGLAIVEADELVRAELGAARDRLGQCG